MSEKEEFCLIRKMLTEIVKEELIASIHDLDTEELGLVIDMIKDLAEAEKYYVETCCMMSKYENVDFDEDKNSTKSILTRNVHSKDSKD